MTYETPRLSDPRFDCEPNGRPINRRCRPCRTVNYCQNTHELELKVLLVTTFFFALTILFSSTVAQAHVGKRHLGRTVVGTLIVVTSEKITIRTSQGEESVALRADTEVERGDAHMSVKDLEVGQTVTIYGTKIPGGEFVARTVIIEPRPAAPGQSAPR